MVVNRRMGTFFQFVLVGSALVGLGYCGCRRANWWDSFDEEGLSKCDEDHEYVRGFERNDNGGSHDGIYRLEKAECCSRCSPWTNSKTQTMNVDWLISLDTNYMWSTCPSGYFLQGLYRSDEAEGLHNIEEGRCSKPADHPYYYGHCYDHNIGTCFDGSGLCQCNNGYFVTGLYRGGCDRLYCLETLRCCKMADEPEELDGMHAVKSRIMDTTMADIALLAHYLGYGWCGGCRSPYVGEDFRRNGDSWAADKTSRCSGHMHDNRLNIDYNDWGLKIVDITYGQHVIEELQPQTIDSGSIQNYDPTASEERIQFTETSVRSVTHTKTSSFSVSHDMGIEINYTPPMATGGVGGSVSYRFGFESAHSTQDSTGREQVRTFTISTTKIIPPYSTSRYRLILSKTRTTVPYTATVIAKFSAELRSFLRWGGGRSKRNTNYHQQYRGRRHSPFSYRFGSDSTPFYTALKRQSQTSSQPWLWHAMKNAHSSAQNLINELSNEDRYEFTITGKFEDVIGFQTDLIWEGGEPLNRRRRSVVSRNETVNPENIKHIKQIAEAGPDDPPSPDVDPPLVHIEKPINRKYRLERVIGDV